jgi:hypothetical protein
MRHVDLHIDIIHGHYDAQGLPGTCEQNLQGIPALVFVTGILT